MVKKKSDKFTGAGRMNILCYDDENIVYYHGVPTLLTNERPYVERVNYIEDVSQTTIPCMFDTITVQTDGIECLENITLDDTTMRRIAVFNKNQECKRLDKQIKEKEERIKKLDDLLQDKEKRWEKVKEFIKDIYDISVEEDYDDYDYYD